MPTKLLEKQLEQIIHEMVRLRLAFYHPKILIKHGDVPSIEYHWVNFKAEKLYNKAKEMQEYLVKEIQTATSGSLKGGD